MEMQYKFDLGCKLMPRRKYLENVWNVRESKASLVLPTNEEENFNAREIIDKNLEGEERKTPKHQTPFDAEKSLPEKKRPKNSDPH